MLDTACRPGEILSLQWCDVSLDRRELTIRAEKEKDATRSDYPDLDPADGHSRDAPSRPGRQ
jgi:integrase